MLRSTTRVPNIIFDKNLNSLTIRSTPQDVELVEKLLRVWDKPKGEVVIDLEIMEVSRIKERQLGISFDSNQVGLVYNGATTGADILDHGVARPRLAGFLQDRELLHQPAHELPRPPGIGRRHEDHRPAAPARGLGRGDAAPGRPEDPHPPDIVLFDRRGRSEPAAGHELHPAGRRHRDQDQADGPPRSGGDPGPRDQSDIARGNGLRRHPDHQHPRDQEHHPPPGRGDEPAGRPAQGRGAADDQGHPRPQGHPAPWTAFLGGGNDDRAERRHPDHHSIHHPDRPGHGRRREAALDRRGHVRLGGRPSGHARGRTDGPADQSGRGRAGLQARNLPGAGGSNAVQLLPGEFRSRRSGGRSASRSISAATRRSAT